MATNKRVRVGLDFDVNLTEINQLKEQIKNIRIDIGGKEATGKITDDLRQAKKAADDLENILNSSWNNKLGQLDLSKLNKSIQDSYGSLSNFRGILEKSGSSGVNLFNNFSRAVLGTNTQIKQTNKLLNDMTTSMSNTVKWGVTSAIFNNITNSIQKAWDYSLRLDSSLNDIRIVTGKSADEMERFAQTANKAAKSLGASTTDYTEAALIYYQQGLSEEEVQARANTTLKVANVTGQSGQAVSEQLTAVWNGYKVSAEEAESYIDKLSAVAATTAADLEELSTGMSKVASAASTMGVDIDQLNAQLATIVSVTRQAPESVGTALKTIYARMSDIEAGVAEDGATLGNYTEQMERMGISVLNAKGELRDMGEVIEEIGGNWSNYTREQQIALAQIMAGTRQYNNLVALFDNWEMYSKALDDSKNSAGALQKQQDIYMESTEAHLQKLATEAERTYDILFDENAVKTMSSALTGLLGIMNSFFAGLGGGLNAFSFVGMSAANLFSSQISDAITQAKYNKDINKINQESLNEKRRYRNALDNPSSEENHAHMASLFKEMFEIQDAMSEEEQVQTTEAIKRLDVLEQEIRERERLLQILKESRTLQESEIDVEKLNPNQFREAASYLNNELITASNLGQILKGIPIDEIDGDSNQQKFSTRLYEASQKYSGLKAKTDEWVSQGGYEGYKDRQGKKITKRDINKMSKQYLDDMKKQYEKEFETILEDFGYDATTASKNTIEIMKKLKEQVFLYAEVPDKISFDKVMTEATEALKAEEDKIANEMEEARNLYDKVGTKRNAKGEKTNTAANLKKETEDAQKKADVEIEKLSAKFKKIFNKEELAIQIKGYTTIFNTINSITSLWRIVTDESISGTEKMTQFLTVFGAAAIQVVTNWSDVTKTLGILKGGIINLGKEYLKATLASVTFANGTTFATRAAEVGFKKATLEAIKFQGSISALIWPILAVVAAIGAVVAIVSVAVDAYNAERDAAEAAQKQLGELTETYNELNKKAQEFKNITSDYDDSIKALKEMNKYAKDYEETLEETNKKAKELITTYGLYDDYHYEDGAIVFNDGVLENLQADLDAQALSAETQMYGAQITANKTAQLADAKDIANSANVESMLKASLWNLLPGAGNIVSAVQMTNQLSTQEVNSVVAALRNAKDTDMEAYSKAIGSESGLKDFIKTTFKGNQEMKAFADELSKCGSQFESLIASIEKSEKANDYYADQLNLISIKKLYGENIEKLATDSDGNVDTKKVEQIAVALNNTQAQENAKRNKVSERRVALTTAENWNDEWNFQGGQNKRVLELAEKYGYFDNQDAEFKQRFESLRSNDDEDLLRVWAKEIKGMSDEEVSNLVYSGKQLKNEKGEVIVDGSEKQLRAQLRSDIYNLITSAFIDKAFDNVAKSDTEAANQEIKNIQEQAKLGGSEYGVDFTNVVLDMLGSDGSKIDLSSLFGEISPDEREKLLKLADNPEELQELLGLSDEAMSLWGKNLTELAKSFKASLEEYDVSDFLKTLEIRIQNVKGVISTLFEGGDLDEDQIALLEGLEAEYEELGMIRDRSSKRYLEALQEVNEELENERIELEQFQAAELVKEIDFTADPKELENTLEDITEAEYEVLVAIKADVQSDFDNIVNKMTGIEDMATKIGDNFVVSASDLEEINNVFPGILNNMTLLNDGTAKLSKESVQAAMIAAQEELKINTEKTVKDLELQRDELLGKQESALKIAEIARKIASEEETLDTNQLELEKELNNLSMGNAEVTADFEKDTQKDVADSSVENANAMASNFSGAYKKMAEDSKAWADAAKKNMLVARLGFGKTTLGSFTSDYVADQKGVNINTAEEGDLSGKEDLTTVTDWNAVAEHYEELAKNYGEAANNVQGKIAEILARNNSLNVVTSNVGLGLGSDGKAEETKEEIAEILEMLEDEADIYHDINIEIQNTETNLKRLQKQQEKTYGAELIDNLNEQLKLLNKQTENYAEKIKIASVEAAALRAMLDANGVTFNEDGTIANYKQAFENQKKIVDDLRVQYNNMTKEEQEAFQDTLDKAEKKFEVFKENIEEYDEIITDLIPGLEDDIQEALDEEIEIAIEKFNMEIETRLDMSQAERDWNEFKKRIIDGIDDDDILGNAKANLEDFSSYYKDNFEGVIQVNTDHVNDILFELEEMDKGLSSKYYGEDRAQALEDLKTYYGQLMDDLTAVEDLSEKIRQSYLDMMDEAKEKFDEQISTYEQIADLIDHDMKLIELLGGEKSYAAFGEYYNKLEVNNNKQLDFQRQQVEFWKAQMDSADEGSERWQKAKENWMAAVTDWRDLVNSSIENLQDKYLNTISSIFEELNKKVTNELGLEYVNEQWGLINRNAEEYLDTINAMYGIQELENKYLDAIDQTDSISAQQELNKLMEQEIAALEEKDKLTQYDIDRANMRYNIALKQIALEEAQQNKTSMRLKRDSQGNYSYQFIADEDAVGKAEDELAAAQNELYNFDKENYINNLDELYAAYEEYQQKMFEAAQINDPDERLQREALLNKEYGELINGLVEQNQTIRSNLHESAFDELARLYNTDVENYRKMSEEERNILLNEMIPQWTSGVQQMADTFAGEGGLGEVCKESLAEISQATEDYKDDLEEVEDAAGLTFEEIVGGTDNAISETEDLLDVNDELIEQYEDELDAIDAVIDELDELIEKFEEAKQAAIEASKAAYEYTQSADDDMADEAFEDRDYSEDMTRAIVSGYSTDDKHYQSLARRRDKKIAESNVQTDVTSSRLKKLFDAYRAGDPKAQTVVMAVYNGEADYTDKFLDEYGFKTGGYTGNWTGEAGRLALLHQKELVLNAEDTQNVLGAVKILRNITDLIGNSVIRKAAAMSGNITTPQGGNITNETLEQDVHIDAHFPNVTNSREIENALDNLMNKASQRALRKR